VSSIQASSMVVTFQHKIILRPGSMFCFGTISSIADEEGTLHRIADPPERKFSSRIFKKIGAKQEKAQPPVLRKKTTFSKLGAEGPSAWRTPLSTSPTEEWTQITRKKEAKDHQAGLSVPPSSKENRKKIVVAAAPFYPDVLFIGRVESPPISDDEPPAPGEEPPQREFRRRGNRRRNIRRHHEVEERDSAQPISRDEASEMGETPLERVFRERRNSRRRDRRRTQEQAEQKTRQRRENPLFGCNLNPDFARAMNTPSEVGGVLARIADGLPRTPDTEGYRRLFTQAANHLLPLAHPLNDLRHAINSRWDARSSINASRKRRHENEIRRREEYDRDHGIPARSQATRTESTTASTGGTTRGRSRYHDNHSPPWDRQHHRRQEDTCGVSALTPRLRAIQWPPNFKVSNVDKYEPKQDPGGWLDVYTTAARAVGATEDIMTTYLPIVLGQDALQWLRHLPRHCIDNWSDFSRRFTANFQSLSDKPAQPWDLKSIKLRGDETLRSYLKRFQTMRNHIPEVAEAAVIEDFYRGSNDSAFVRTILQKAPTTSEQLFREADLYITTDERAQDLIGGAKPTPAAPRRDTNQQPDKRWEKRPREEVHAAGPPASRARGEPRGGKRTLDDIFDAQCPYHKDMRHTLRNCRDFKHFVGHGRPFQPLPPPPPRGGPGEPRQPQQQEEGGGGAFPRVDREVNVIFSGHGSQESKRQQKLNDRQILVAATGPPASY
jgi:hypothetical protein